MKILIIGGNGFLGSRIANYLIKKNYEIKVLIRYQKKNLLDKKIKKIIYNWNNEEILNNSLKKIDFVINCTGTNSLTCKKFYNYSKKCYLENSEKISEYLLQNKIKYFINFSTSQIYDSKKFGDIDESGSIKLDNNYKKLNFKREKIFEDKLKKRVKYINLRITNCFGYIKKSNNNYWRLIVPNLCKNLFKHKKFKLKSKKNFYRNYCTATDLCRFIDYCIKNDNIFKYSVLNFSNNKPIKLSEITSKILNSFYKINKTKLKYDSKLKLKDANLRSIKSSNLKNKFKFLNNFNHEISHIFQKLKKNS